MKRFAVIEYIGCPLLHGSNQAVDYAPDKQLLIEPQISFVRLGEDSKRHVDLIQYAYND